MFFSDGLHDFVGILFLLLACRMFSLQRTSSSTDVRQVAPMASAIGGITVENFG